jgi:integrase/recombinase XerD
MTRNDSKARQTSTVDPQGMTPLLGRFLDWLAVKNYAERTVAIRRTCVGYFITWAEQRGVTRPSEVTRPVLERYQRYLFNHRKANGEPLSVRTQCSRLASVKSWFKWLAKHNHILYNPAGELEMPRLELRLPRAILSAREAEMILALPKVGEVLGLRDRAILETLYSTGMRRMELVNLKVYDIDRERGTVMIRQGKGRKDRLIPIGSRALAWVEKYLLEGRPRLEVGERSAEVLFLTNLGEAFHPVHMTKLVRDYVVAADLGKRGSCHLFRHTMATLMLEGGADIRFIQAMLGHAKLDTTQVYTQVSIRMLKEIHTATHPARMEQKPSKCDDKKEGRQAGQQRIE